MKIFRHTYIVKKSHFFDVFLDDVRIQLFNNIHIRLHIKE